MNARLPILFASPVKDLTIARYLAAMNVDFIGIDLDIADNNKLLLLINQFKAWIEGPKFIGVSAFPIQMHQLEYGLDGFYSDSDLSGIENVIRIHSLEYYKNNLSSLTDFVIINTPDDVIDQIACLLCCKLNQTPFLNEKIYGLLIQPGLEEKTGLFDFEELNLWFERLSISP